MDYGYGGGGAQYNTSYGAQGGANGGGFMAGSGSQTSPSGGKYSKDESLRPVTVKQLNEAAEVGDDFKIDGTPFSQVMFIGQVRNISTQSTNITYRVDDGTGSIDVKKWTDPDTRDALEDGSSSTLTQDTYVKVWGKMKSFNNKRHVGATFVRPISDFNEISHHLLEAALAHLYFSRGPLAVAKGNAANQVGQTDTNMSVDTGYGAGDSFLRGASANAKKFYQVMKETPQSNEGLHIQEIASRLNMEVNAVDRAADELLSAGYIYTTVDDSTWALLNTTF